MSNLAFLSLRKILENLQSKRIENEENTKKEIINKNEKVNKQKFL